VEAIVAAATNHGDTSGEPYTGAGGPTAALLGNSGYCTALGNDNCTNNADCNAWTITSFNANLPDVDADVDCTGSTFWKG